ncbi:hypothetical protein PM082_016664 [Marasmius tenuissimus]|nr:hypothetical protein PM082_016664 [Marasmius tenuissimus]
MPQFVCRLDDPNYPYPYCPNFTAAIVFAALFGLSTLLHLIQAIHYRKPFCWVIIMAGTWETASYALRALSRYDISPEGLGVPSQFLVQLAPLWVNAFVYMVFGRVVHYFIPEKSVAGVSARRMSLVFVLLDLFSFLIQAAGAVLAQSRGDGDDTSNLITIGLRVYQAGIGVQELFILIFLAVAVRCEIKLRAIDHEQYRSTSWRKVLWPIYVALILITIRIVYRLVEFASGFESGLVTKETPFYILEAGPMTLCMFVFNVFHPGAVLVGEDSEFPKKEKKRKGSETVESTDSLEMEMERHDERPLAHAEKATPV